MGFISWQVPWWLRCSMDRRVGWSRLSGRLIGSFEVDFAVLTSVRPRDIRLGRLSGTPDRPDPCRGLRGRDACGRREHREPLQRDVRADRQLGRRQRGACQEGCGCFLAPTGRTGGGAEVERRGQGCCGAGPEASNAASRPTRRLSAPTRHACNSQSRETKPALHGLPVVVQGTEETSVAKAAKGVFALAAIIGLLQPRPAAEAELQGLGGPTMPERRPDRRPCPEWSGEEVGFAPQPGSIMGRPLALGRWFVFGKAWRHVRTQDWTGSVG